MGRTTLVETNGMLLRLLKKAKTTDDMHAGLRELKDAVRTAYKPSSAKSKICATRKYARELLAAEDDESPRSVLLQVAVADLMLTKAEYGAINKVTEEKLKHNARGETFVIPQPRLALLVQAKAYMTSADVYERIGALLLLTGRRTFEVARHGSIALMRGKRWRVTFTGQAKTTEEMRFGIPVLANPVAVVACWESVQAEFAHLEDDCHVIQAKLGAKLNTFVKDWIGLTPHKLRGAYADLCWTYRGKRTGMAHSLYLESILGHVGTSAITAYECVRFQEDVDQYDHSESDSSDAESYSGSYSASSSSSA